MKLISTLAVLLAGAVFATGVRADEAPVADAKTAIEKGLKRIQAGAAQYPEHRQCFSCHHQAMAVFSLTAAQRRGFPIDADLLAKQIDFSLNSFHNTTEIAKGRSVGGDSTSVGYILNTLAAVERPGDETTAALVEYLLVKQRPVGSWPAPGQRPPTMGSPFTNTALALVALKKYGPRGDESDAEAVQKRIDDAIARGRTWLLDTKPTATEDKVFRLRGLVAVAADKKDVESARDLLMGEQLADGGWAQLPDKLSDAYATGTVLTALCTAGLPSTDPVYKKGTDYLLKTQKEDGSWIVETRSKPLQRFFDNGDPGGKSQFISFAATGWAVLALLEQYPRQELHHIRD